MAQPRPWSDVSLSRWQHAEQNGTSEPENGSLLRDADDSSPSPRRGSVDFTMSSGDEGDTMSKAKRDSAIRLMKSPSQRRSEKGLLDWSQPSYNRGSRGLSTTPQQAMVRRSSYQFDGAGSFHVIPWSVLQETGEQNTNDGRGVHSTPAMSAANTSEALYHESSTPLLTGTPSAGPLKVTDSTAMKGGSFFWFHLVIPRTCPSLTIAARQVISYFHPPLPLPHAVALLANGPFCSVLDNALIFRINSPGPLDSPYSFRIAVRMTKSNIVSVALGNIPRLELNRSIVRASNSPLNLLVSPEETPTDDESGASTTASVKKTSSLPALGFRLSGAAEPQASAGRPEVKKTSPMPAGKASTSVKATRSSAEASSPTRIGLLNSSPAGSPFGPVGTNESSESVMNGHLHEEFVIDEQDLEDLLRGSHPDSADCAVPCSTFELLLHVVETHVDQILDVVVELEMNLDLLERQLDSGADRRREHLKERTFPKMHLDLQRLLQSISHCEVVLPRLHDRLLARRWCSSEDATALNGLMARLRRTKENMGFLASRITALQAGLDQWQAEQINRKLYYLSILSMVFLPISFITGLFGMNVGGVPWVPQLIDNPKYNVGFSNILWMCFAVVVFTLVVIVVGPFILNYCTALLHSEAFMGLVSWFLEPVFKQIDKLKAWVEERMIERGLPVPWLPHQGLD